MAGNNIVIRILLDLSVVLHKIKRLKNNVYKKEAIMKGFTHEEIKRLVYLADKNKKEGKSLSSVFSKFAAESGRAKGSVRNFYYGLLSAAEKGDERCLNYLKDANLKSEKFDKFTRKNEEEMLENIFTAVGQGKSVRRAIIELSDGEEKTILRYQNKYRNLILKNRTLVEKVVEKVRRKGINLVSPYQKSVNDVMLINRLKNEINLLVGRISEDLRKENCALKKRLVMFENENATLLSLKENTSVSKAIAYYTDDKKIL